MESSSISNFKEPLSFLTKISFLEAIHRPIIIEALLKDLFSIILIVLLEFLIIHLKALAYFIHHESFLDRRNSSTHFSILRRILCHLLIRIESFIYSEEFEKSRSLSLEVEFYFPKHNT